MTLMGKCGIFAAAAVLSLCLYGCGRNSGSGYAVTDARKIYEPQVNEVDTVTLRRTVFFRQLVSNGKLSAAEKSSLSFSSPGRLAGIYFRNGGSVRKGDMIAVLDRDMQELSLRSARLSLAKAEMELYDVLAGQGYKAKDTLSVPSEILSMAKMRSGYAEAANALAKAEHDFAGTALYAPFSGKVADISLNLHDLVTSDKFCTLVDDSFLNVDFTVLESEYSFVEEGLGVKVSPFSSDGRSLSGNIVSVNPVVDKNGLVAVRAVIRNDGSLIDGMNVRVCVEKRIDDMLVVPKSAVLIRDNEEILFRYREGKAQWTYVNILMDNMDSYAVEANADRGADLNVGDKIIVSGNLNLADGSDVAAVKH